ncbi:MAG: YihY/virulence factor BrkB family protein [Nocardioides sp.]|nr:YihY/virulence factor BrkB family protein [Nocardioidaceae bacterium]MCB8958626.1 YihY/virulence factor BrkB family protein [Nocardioides sp.]
MDVRALRGRLTTSYRTRRDQAKDLVDRIPVLGRLVNEFVRIEFIDRCMLIAAQGLLALIPTFVVLVAFFPHLMSSGVHQLAELTGLGSSGDQEISGEVTVDQVRTQTGVIGIVITLLSATSFARAIQRMYERVWEQPHVGGMSGARRCFVWLLGWMASVQTVSGVLRLLSGPDGVLPVMARLGLQIVLVSAVWLVTSRVLLFGRVAWSHLLLGAVLTGVIQVLYSRGSSLVMQPYVEQNAQQFGTLGVILAISTWMIGFGAILVGSALVGRVVSEDPTVGHIVRSSEAAVRASWLRLRGHRPEQADATAAPPPAGSPPRSPGR